MDLSHRQTRKASINLGQPKARLPSCKKKVSTTTVLDPGVSNAVDAGTVVHHVHHNSAAPGTATAREGTGGYRILRTGAVRNHPDVEAPHTTARRMGLVVARVEAEGSCGVVGWEEARRRVSSRRRCVVAAAVVVADVVGLEEGRTGSSAGWAGASGRTGSRTVVGNRLLTASGMNSAVLGPNMCHPGPCWNIQSSDPKITHVR